MSKNITVIDYEEIELYTLINKKGREIKSSLFFNYILRYTNTENIDDFLKRFEKV